MVDDGERDSDDAAPTADDGERALVDDGERDSDDVAPTAHDGERALVDDGEHESDDAAPTAAGAGERASGPAAAILASMVQNPVF